MTSPHQRQRRKVDLRRRISSPQDSYEVCRIYPCANRTTADQGKGLNRLYCRKHIEFYRRHGSYVKRSYGAGELRPYRIRAKDWLIAHAGTPMVTEAINCIGKLYASSGMPVEAFRLAGMTPPERARATWAQLRKRSADPMDVAANWLAVGMRLADDPQPDRHEEFRLVQAAKLIHRLAGGAHKRWERTGRDGKVEVREMHKHPVSRGRVLRILGSDIAKACRSLPEFPLGDQN